MRAGGGGANSNDSKKAFYSFHFLFLSGNHTPSPPNVEIVKTIFRSHGFVYTEDPLKGFCT